MLSYHFMANNPVTSVEIKLKTYSTQYNFGSAVSVCAFKLLERCTTAMNV